MISEFGMTIPDTVDVIEAKDKSAKPKKKIINKLCPKCGKNKHIENFYSNKDWADQLGKDLWCKDCVAKLSTKEEIREYFWYNNRLFDEKIWNAALTCAENKLTSNTTYIKSSGERRRSILERFACKEIPRISSRFYQYNDNSQGGTITYDEVKNSVADEEDSERYYSAEFNGWFTKRDLEYLENYYSKMEQDFAFDNESARDYARKACKQSLIADKAQDLYAAGKVDSSAVKDALAQFDMLCKSGNFAACRRKPGDTNGITSFSELTYKLETSGYPCTRTIDFPKDDVDIIIEEFKHTLAAASIDSSPAK